jgi:DNA-3-methyladenine glycosylase
MHYLLADFFERDACEVAKTLLGKVILHRHQGHWLSAMIIETEAYYLEEKASHSSLGYTEKRAALFMPAGTIYMYYSRGGDSMNISCRGEGNAVLIKSGLPYAVKKSANDMLSLMQTNNPAPQPNQVRNLYQLCKGQTLLCKSLGIRVPEWDKQPIQHPNFALADVDYQPEQIIQTARLGIPAHRDAHLPYRYIDYTHAAHCTQNPLRKRNWQQGTHYQILTCHKALS